MVSKYLESNSEIVAAKGDIPYWVIAKQLGVHENTVRNWMKREMDPKKKKAVLSVIHEIKQKEKQKELMEA